MATLRARVLCYLSISVHATYVMIVSNDVLYFFSKFVHEVQGHPVYMFFINFNELHNKVLLNIICLQVHMKNLYVAVKDSVLTKLF